MPREQNTLTTIRRALFLSLAERYLNIVLQLILFFVLARLLTPEDIGLYSVAVALIGLAHVLRDFGVPSYLIQEVELTDARIRTAFTLMLIIALGLFSLIFLASGPAADFYRDERLKVVVQIMSCTFILIPFSSTALALLRRNMRFDALFRINIAAGVVGFVVALGMASIGYGYWSLVWSSIATTLATSGFAAWFAKGAFVHRPTLSQWRRVVGFGSQASLAHIVTEVAMKMSDLVAGKVLGFTAVGILSRAQGVMNLVHRDLLGAVRNVAYPAFARAFREGANMEELHRKSTATAAAFAWPLYGFFSLFSLEALRVMFGHQWDAAAPLVPIFCTAGAVGILWVFSLPMLTAVGRVNLMMKAELIIQPFRIGVFIACGYVFDTIDAFAYGLLLVYIVQLFVAYGFKQAAIAFEVRPMIRALMHSAVLSLMTLAPAVLLKFMLDLHIIELSSAVAVLLGGGLTVLMWPVAVMLLKHPIQQEKYFCLGKLRIQTMLMIK